MKEIGGYFSLELSQIDNCPQTDGVMVNSGRNALELVLRSIPRLSKVYIPYFTCDVVLEPFKKLSVPYTFYRLNTLLELEDEISLEEGEYILYTNYYGVKDTYVAFLEKNYQGRLIVDNAQALYASPTSKCIYSPRKFVGIPDGGIAYTDFLADNLSFEMDYSYDRCSHLLIRHDKGASEGYLPFKENSSKLKNLPIRKMSSLTCSLMSSIDFKDVKRKRILNFEYLHYHLGNSNHLPIDAFGKFECPLVYPYYTDDTLLKQHLISNKVFVATYWPNVLDWCTEDMAEFQMAQNIIAIPIDQRYGIENMNSIIEIIKAK